MKRRQFIKIRPFALVECWLVQNRARRRGCSPGTHLQTRTTTIGMPISVGRSHKMISM